MKREREKRELRYTLFFYKKPVYDQPNLGRQIFKQHPEHKPLSLSNNRYCRLKKVEFFLFNKRKIAVKLTIPPNPAVSKALLGKFQNH